MNNITTKQMEALDSQKSRILSHLMSGKTIPQ